MLCLLGQRVDFSFPVQQSSVSLPFSLALSLSRSVSLYLSVYVFGYIYLHALGLPIFPPYKTFHKCLIQQHQSSYSHWCLSTVIIILLPGVRSVHSKPIFTTPVIQHPSTIIRDKETNVVNAYVFAFMAKNGLVYISDIVSVCCFSLKSCTNRD